MFLKKVFSLLIVSALLVPPGTSYAQMASDALIGTALKYYNHGFYQEALHEFSNVLLVEPENEQAKFYIQQIRNKQDASRGELIVEALDKFEPAGKISPEAKAIIINRESDRKLIAKKIRRLPLVPGEIEASKETEQQPSYVDIKGEYQVSAGIRSPDKFIWKEANGDLNERNWRILWSEGRHNTYDPAIFDRLRVNVDTKNLSELGLDNISAHLNLTVDPWSFTGKSDKFTIRGVGGDLLELELKYWSNTGRTINQVVNTLVNGDAVALPEIKVIDGATASTRIRSTFGNTFTIPAQKLERTFMPVREFWVDYKEDDYKLRLFPIAYQDQALTTDDPLGLSNHHTWWEESPWLADWRPGNLNRGATPDDFTKGIWDDSLAFFTRDNDNLRLTALRGVAFEFNGIDAKVKSTIASPKNLWADYSEFNTYASATRLTYDAAYNLGLGFTHTGHFGYKDGVLDGLNNVFSADVKHEPFIGTKLSGQVAASESTFDRTSDFLSRKRGNSYLLSLENRFPADDIYEQDYNAITKSVSEQGFLKSRIRVVRMDRGFESSLASFRQTRDDEFWSRHVSFRKHPLYLYTGLTSPMKFDDIKPFAIGDGIDAGRDVVGMRLEGKGKFLSRNIDGLFDVRNVHDVDGGFIENVSRVELGYDVTDKLTTKLLGIRQDLPKTRGGFDPFVFDSATGKPLINTAIKADKDPSLKTASAGFDYKLTEKISFNSVWEYTNDSTVATGDYPRGLFNDSNFVTFTENGKVYREPIPFLYSQTGFDLPPYHYFNIYKSGFSLRPVRELEFYLDFAYNENKKAGQIDDNMNHYGFEVAYTPTSKLSFLFKYTYSRWIDMLMLNASGREIYNWHNNFFLESRYQPDQSTELIFEYGVGGITPLGSVTYDPFGGALAVLDTQHIVRLYYKKKF